MNSTSDTTEHSKIFEIIASSTPDQLKDLEEHLKREPQSVHSLEPSGNSVLHVALKRNHEILSFSLCEILLLGGADPLSKGSADKNVLHVAADKGLERCVELLLKAGSSMCSAQEMLGWVNEKDDAGFAPADHAVQEGYFGILKKLYAAGADLHCQDKQGMNLLHTAMICASDGAKTEEMMAWLIEQGVSLKHEDHDGKTPKDYRGSYSKLGVWLEGVEHAMIEREALEGVLFRQLPEESRGLIVNPADLSTTADHDSGSKISTPPSESESESKYSKGLPSNHAEVLSGYRNRRRI